MSRTVLPQKSDWNGRRDGDARAPMKFHLMETTYMIKSTQSLLVRSDGEVVDGHLRLKAARKLGFTEVPAILCDEWTPAQVSPREDVDARHGTALTCS